MNKFYEIFPRKETTRPTRTHLPENMKKLSSHHELKTFIPHLGRNGKIYFYILDLELKYQIHFGNLTKKILCPDAPDYHVDYLTMVNRLKKKPDQSHKKNTDIRTGYKLRNCFLVKGEFTFGRRTVEPNTVHVVQTTTSPLLFYWLDPRFRTTAPPRQGVFDPTQLLKFYHKTVLERGSGYVVPGGTTYLLLTVQTCFFSLDVVKADTDLPFPVSDPTASIPKTVILDPYAKPPETPHVEEKPDYVVLQERREGQQPLPVAVPEERDSSSTTMTLFFPGSSDETQQQQQQQQEQQQALPGFPELRNSSTVTLFFPGPAEPVPVSYSCTELPSESPLLRVEEQQQQQQQQQQSNPDPTTIDLDAILDELIPPPPPIVIRRNVQIVPVDVAEAVRFYANRTYPDPVAEFPVDKEKLRTVEPVFPLDLSLRTV